MLSTPGKESDFKIQSIKSLGSTEKMEHTLKSEITQKSSNSKESQKILKKTTNSQKSQTSLKSKKNVKESSSFYKYFKNIFLLINATLVLLLMQLSKSFLITKYFDQIDSLPFEINEINITLIIALIYSIVLSDNLSILKGIPILQMFFLSYIIKTYDVENIGIICLGLSIVLTVFYFLRVYKLYVFIPYSVIVGVKICLSLLFCMEMVFYSRIRNKTPSVFVFYDLLAFLKDNSDEFSRFYVFFFFLLITCLFILHRYGKFLPFVMIMVFLSISIGFGMLLVGPLITINFMKLPNFLDFFFPINYKFDFFSKYDNIQLLINRNFIKDIILYSSLVNLEFLATVKLLQRNKSEKPNVNRELKFLIFINLIQSFFGLLPITVGLDTNLAIKSVKGHYKYYYFVGLVLIIIYPVYLYPIFSMMPLYLFSIIISCLFFFNISVKDFSFLGFFDKKGLVFILVLFFFNFQMELLICVFFGIIIFFVFYLQNEKNKSFFIKKDFEIEDKQPESEDEEKLIFNTNDILQSSLRNPGFKNLLENSTFYVFDGIFNFFYSNFHINNICDDNKKNVILDFSKIKEYDSDFFDEYFIIVQALIKKGKAVYLTGFDKICFKRKIFVQKWIYDLYDDNKVIFLEE